MSASRKSVVAALVRYASSSSKTTSRSRPKPRASNAAAAAANQLVPGSPPLPSSLQERNETWVEVTDPNTGQIYYWNKSTDETTAIGEPRPGPLGRQQAMPGPVRSIAGMIGMGAGVGLAFALISRLF